MNEKNRTDAYHYLKKRAYLCQTFCQFYWAEKKEIRYNKK